MLDYEKISMIYFSPSGTTKMIVSEIAKNFNLDKENYDLLSFDSEKIFKNELVIIGMPVFNGRIPKTAKMRLSKMKAENTNAIVILNYGNMGVGDALLELTELLKENSFNIIGVATTVSQNSLFEPLAKNRPDENDLARISDFSRQIIEKLENGTSNEIFVSGYKPYQEYLTPDFSVLCDYDRCTECLDCAYTCPEQAISYENPRTTSIDDCSRCSTCINVCSEDARSFAGDIYEHALHEAVAENPNRNEAEFYL